VISIRGNMVVGFFDAFYLIDKAGSDKPHQGILQIFCPPAFFDLTEYKFAIFFTQLSGDRLPNE